MKADVAAGISARLGSLPVARAEERTRWTVGGIVPGAVAFPRTVDELAEVMGRASEEGWGVLPAGRGRWLAGGGLPSHVDLVVSTRKMDQVTEYVPDDLSLTAEGGLGLDTLARSTREHGQWLAQDPPDWWHSSLGAFVATGLPGPLAAGFGRPRDHLLGLTVVTGEGRVIRPGGKVVKNVAGFDLVRLLAGSWGTLGVIASATVRLYPLPRADVTLVLEEPLTHGGAGDSAPKNDAAGGGVPPALVERARAWATAAVVPEALELVVWSPGDHRGGRVTLAARIQGSVEEVAEKERILREAASPSELHRLEGEESRRFHRTLVRGPEDQAEEGSADGSLSVRLSALPIHLADVVGVGERIRNRGIEAGHRARLRASVTRGTVSVDLASPASPSASSAEVPFPTAEWGPLLESARDSLEGLNGSLTVLRKPRTLANRVPDRAPTALRETLSREIRRELDPAGILTPGRMEGDPAGSSGPTGVGSATVVGEGP